MIKFFYEYTKTLTTGNGSFRGISCKYEYMFNGCHSVMWQYKTYLYFRLVLSLLLCYDFNEWPFTVHIPIRVNIWGSHIVRTFRNMLCFKAGLIMAAWAAETCSHTWFKTLFWLLLKLLCLDENIRTFLRIYVALTGEERSKIQFPVLKIVRNI